MSDVVVYVVVSTGMIDRMLSQDKAGGNLG